MKKFLNKFNIILFSLILGCVLVDQISKIVFFEVDKSIIGDFFQIKFAKNTGVAFSFLSGAVWIFIPFTILFIFILLFFYFKTKNKNTLLAVGIGLLLAGAIGNLIDRIFLGYVRDFIYFNFFPAIFNFADICVTIGTILFVIYVLFFMKKEGGDEPKGV